MHPSHQLGSYEENAVHEIVPSPLVDCRILSVPLRIVNYRLDLHSILGTRNHQAVPRNEMPFTFLIGAWLASNDDMLPVIFDGFAGVSVCHWNPVGVVGILAIQGRASGCGVVSRFKLSEDTMVKLKYHESTHRDGGSCVS